MESQVTPVIIENIPVYDLGHGHHALMSEKFLRDIFGKIGCIAEGKIIIREMKGDEGMPASYAIINFKTRKMAERAIEECNYKMIDDYALRISLADHETNMIKKSGLGMLIIKGLPPDTVEMQLGYSLEIFGKVISCKVPKRYDPKDKAFHSIGYGIVQFRNLIDAEKARIGWKKGLIIDTSKITIETYIPPRSGNTVPGTNIYFCRPWFTKNMVKK